MTEPLVSIGIPTYNRPAGLRRTLDCILRQTYTTMEIIVSDNGSTNSDVEAVCQEYSAVDQRIKIFRQLVNQGPAFNFRFVKSRATGNLFMWAADDDFFESPDLIAKLVAVSVGNCTLVFPDINILNTATGIVQHNVLALPYGSCSDSNQYLLAWCRSGAGYPFYGMYNLKVMELRQLDFEFDEDLCRFCEGTFLTRLFLDGNVKFVNGVSINYSIGGAAFPPPYKLLIDYMKYTVRMVNTYGKSHINTTFKAKCMWLTIAKHSAFACYLLFHVTKHLMLWPLRRLWRWRKSEGGWPYVKRC